MKIPNKATILAQLDGLKKNLLVRNMLLVGGIGLFIKIISFYKETIVASFYGLSELLDTYLLAFIIPGFVQNVFIGALRHLFVPSYITEISTTNQRGRFQTFTLLSITLIMVLFIVIVLVFGDFLLEILFPDHSASYYNLIRVQSYYILPCLFFWGYSSFLSGLLEINNNYFPSSISQVLPPVTVILFLWFLENDLGDTTLAISVLVGSGICFFYLLAVSYRRNLLFFGPLKINKNIRNMFREYPPKVTSGLLTGINPFVDQFFAAQLVIGSVTAINYGIKIPAFVITMLMLMIGSVLLPHFSRLVNVDMEKAYRQLFKILKWVFIGSFSICIIIIAFSEPIISLLFERKEFTAEDTSVVSKLQQIALVYVPFFVCTLICVNFLTAINKNKFMAWVSFLNLCVNLIMNFVLIKFLGVYGLVLSTTIVYIISSFFYVGFTHQQFKKYLNS